MNPLAYRASRWNLGAEEGVALSPPVEYHAGKQSGLHLTIKKKAQMKLVEFYTRANDRIAINPATVTLIVDLGKNGGTRIYFTGNSDSFTVKELYKDVYKALCNESW